VLRYYTKEGAMDFITFVIGFGIGSLMTAYLFWMFKCRKTTVEIKPTKTGRVCIPAGTRLGSVDGQVYETTVDVCISRRGE
jgi:hypothetical protein